jgi:4-amino-4-deoxy-L-arabinose transferase-like glycosyltransferase
MKRRFLTICLLALIVILAILLRVYKINQIPPSLSWDEAAVGYNAYSIANYGTDEWGVKFPLSFKSFLDYKHPVHIYVTALFVKLFGLSETTTRLPSAVFGVLNVILIFFLADALFKNKWVAYLSAIFLAVSPYNIQFSRFNHELNFAVFFFMLGLFLFIKGLKRKNHLLPLSFASFGVSLLSYHSAKIVVPPIVLLLVVLYFRKLIAVKKLFFVSLGILGVFVAVIVMKPELLGIARLKQTSISTTSFSESLRIASQQYALHFTPQFLFVSGDKNARHSIQSVGEFYKIDAPLLLLGALFLIWQIVKKRSKEAILILSWALLAPIPSAAVGEAPHAARAMFMTGSWHIIAALGVGTILTLFKKRIAKVLFTTLLFLALCLFIGQYLKSYYRVYENKYAIEWQYGMKQVVEYLRGDKNVATVYMTNIRQQPYIFFLYYLKTPTSQFLQTVVYNGSPSRSFNLVSSFSKYHFLNDLDFAYMPAAYGIYYVVTPSEYDGLAAKEQFNVRKLIKYPDGSDAFYIVTAK